MSDEEKKDARTGWRNRRRGSRERITRRQSPEDRALANAARAELVARLREERDFNPDVAGADGFDFVGNLSDEDLAALFEQLTGKRPKEKAKRPAIENVVRKIQAERAAEEAERVEAERQRGRDLYDDGHDCPDETPEQALAREGWLAAEAEANASDEGSDQVEGDDQ